MQNLPEAPFPIFFTGLPIFSLSVHFYSHSLNTETSDFPQPLCSCIKWLLVVTYWLWLLFLFIYYQGLTAIRIVCECIHLHRQFIGYPSIHPYKHSIHTCNVQFIIMQVAEKAVDFSKFSASRHDDDLSCDFIQKNFKLILFPNGIMAAPQRKHLLLRSLLRTRLF